MFTEKRRTAFTLTEILMAFVILSGALALAVSAMHHISLLMTRSWNISLARSLGQHVLSIFAPRVLHASMGVTWEPAGDRFQRSFGGKTSSSPPPARWPRGPVQIWQNNFLPAEPNSEINGVYKGRILAILYAVPAGLWASLDEDSPFQMNEGDAVTFRLIPAENLNKIGERLHVGIREDLWSWVTFPLMKSPVYMKACAGGHVTIELADRSGLSAVLMPYDEMHYLRAERFQVQQGMLCSESLRNTWKFFQYRVDGVLEIWFEWTPAKRLLEAWILTAGGPAVFGKSSRPKEWPPEAPWRSDFERYDIAVSRDSWLVRNL